ncbi:MAG TPA: PspC domain-containing protein, partial [Acidimicrobiales bacterium]
MTETPPEAQPSDAADGAGTRRPVREPEDRRLAGVCAGLADHLGVDVTALRATAVILALLTPLAVLAYAVAALALPERDRQEPRRRRGSPRALPHPLLAVGVLVAAAALAPRAWWLDPFPAAVALIGIGVWLIA